MHRGTPPSVYADANSITGMNRIAFLENATHNPTAFAAYCGDKSQTGTLREVMKRTRNAPILADAAQYPSPLYQTVVLPSWRSPPVFAALSKSAFRFHIFV